MVLYNNEFLHKFERSIVIWEMRVIFSFAFCRGLMVELDLCLPTTDNNGLSFRPVNPYRYSR